MAHSFTIAVTGSGTAGLAAACFLKEAGHHVTMFERFDTPRPVGAGLMLQPTGLACLARLGLDEAAVKTGAKIHYLIGKTDKNRTIFDLDYRDLSPTYFGLGIHRGALFTLLYEKLQKLSVVLQTNTEITSSHTRADKRILIDSRGQEHGPFDLVIDASGKGSLLRNQNAIRVSKPYPYGALWGVVADPDQAFGGNRLAQRYQNAKKMTGMLAIGENPETRVKSCAFFWSLPARDLQSWKDNGLEKWQEKAIALWPDLAPFVSQFKSADQLNYAHYGDIIMHRWHDDRIIHIGDAAHHSSPQLGQGVNLALADALILSAHLSAHQTINEAVHAYQKQRKSHVLFYQQASRMLTPFFQSDSRLASAMRDVSFGLLCKTPFVRGEMLRTLSGIKTGWFSHMNPGIWHERYALNSHKSNH